jgi:pyrroloquinoline quinone biosynthesis protein B
MQVVLLGTAAGGGFPQWNCACTNCQVARQVPARARPRTQSSVAISADGRSWFLVNASPDVRLQIESFPRLTPPAGRVRGSAISGVLLTSADLDHTLGLFCLREGDPLAIHASGAVRHALCQELRFGAIMASYCGLEWQEPPAALAPLCGRDRRNSGLSYAAFPVAAKPPRYGNHAAASDGDAVGYRFVDETTGGRLVVVPGLAEFDERFAREADQADLLLLDGTFFDDDEMRRTGAGTATAAEMGHVVVNGPSGSLAKLAAFSHVERVYIHINNTNPMLLEDSVERRAVVAAGVQIGYDGMQFSL